MTQSEIIAIIAAVTALFAVLLGPLVSMWAANKQASVSVRSNNRQAWINTLRDALAEFASMARVIPLAKEFDDQYTRVEKLFFLEQKMALLLNPSEEPHKNLLRVVAEARTSAVGILAAANEASLRDQKHQQLKALLSELTTVAQPILKKEWERVKRTE